MDEGCSEYWSGLTIPRIVPTAYGALALGDPSLVWRLRDRIFTDADGGVGKKTCLAHGPANMASSVSEMRLTAALQNKPAIIVHGRSDPLFPVNHSSRPFVAKSLATDGVRSKLRYYEVLNAQHWDAANSTAGLIPAMCLCALSAAIAGFDVCASDIESATAIEPGAAYRATWRYARRCPGHYAATRRRLLWCRLLAMRSVFRVDTFDSELIAAAVSQNPLNSEGFYFPFLLPHFR